MSSLKMDARQKLKEDLNILRKNKISLKQVITLIGGFGEYTHSQLWVLNSNKKLPANFPLKKLKGSQ